MIQRIQRIQCQVLATLLLVLTGSVTCFSQTPAANTDESKVPAYQLPALLKGVDGKDIKNDKDWSKRQRPHIYHLFEENVYGRYPAAGPAIRFKIRDSNARALGGTAIRKQVRIFLHSTDDHVFIDLLVYLPAHAQQPVPVFMGYNFGGNQTIMPDTGIFITDSWVSPNAKAAVQHHANAASRGLDTGQWQVREILKHGYGLAVAYYGDIEPDYPEGWKTGIRSSMASTLQIQPQEWGAIGAWAWGLSRIMDYLQQDKSIDGKRIALIGHSRLGKAALWAGASDPRFSIVISNESGEGGAALARRWYGETVAIINQKFPHWFNATYKKFGEDPSQLPVDQHMLLALIAPRPLYVASAQEDQWSDPKGEFLSAKYASAVYALFGYRGIGADSMPPVHQPVGDRVRYHIRAGKHSVTLYDWQQYLAFADRFWKQ